MTRRHSIINTFELFAIIFIISLWPFKGYAEEITFDFKYAKLYMKASDFEPSKHSISKTNVDNWTAITLIDGKPVMGADWDMPKSKLEEAYLEVEGQKIPLDVSCMYNPWFDKPSKKYFTVFRREPIWVVLGLFSDGAGTYIAQWQIVNGVSVRTILSNDERVVFELEKDW